MHFIADIRNGSLRALSVFERNYTWTNICQNFALDQFRSQNSSFVHIPFFNWISTEVERSWSTGRPVTIVKSCPFYDTNTELFLENTPPTTRPDIKDSCLGPIRNCYNTSQDQATIFFGLFVSFWVVSRLELTPAWLGPGCEPSERVTILSGSI